jgi:NADPH-dependent 2,4-dienoyl-CoA reductase/sulfur reductase-like enzyme/rhodanese-related sulfurtransferase
MKIVIVGGVAGGASAAARARRIDEHAEIVVFERGPDVSFANCGLPYYLGGEIADRNKLLVTTAEKLKARFNLDVRTLSKVDRIDRKAKTVLVRHLRTDETYTESYDKLILSPGAAPLRPDIRGVHFPSVHTLRNLEDTDKIKAIIDRGITHAVVVGAGYIGLEMVEALVHKKIHTTVIDRNPQVLGVLDPEMSTPILQELRKHGVNVILNDTVKEFLPADNGVSVQVVTEKSGTHPAGLVILGLGVKPENTLAIQSGLRTGERGGLIVNDHLQTNDPDIYAVGDAIEVTDVVSEMKGQVPLAGPANRQGRLAADHALGRTGTTYRGTQGTAIVRVFGKVAACTGLSEKMLRKKKIDFRSIYIHPANHAGYYPGAEGMTLKLLFAPTNGRILGAQAVGGSGVDKRIDVIAVAIQAGWTVEDLEEAELCYAPPFGSAKDPVNMAGFVAGGLLRGDHPQMSFSDYLAMEPKPYLVDVRDVKEYAAGAVPGAVNIPVDELRGRLTELPKEKPIAVYCQVGQRGYIASRILLQHGYDVVNLSGGYRTWLLWQA